MGVVLPFAGDVQGGVLSRCLDVVQSRLAVFLRRRLCVLLSAVSSPVRLPVFRRGAGPVPDIVHWGAWPVGDVVRRGAWPTVDVVCWRKTYRCVCGRGRGRASLPDTA